jgi:hypothetical protein
MDDLVRINGNAGANDKKKAMVTMNMTKADLFVCLELDGFPGSCF